MIIGLLARLTGRRTRTHPRVLEERRCWPDQNWRDFGPYELLSSTPEIPEDGVYLLTAGADVVASQGVEAAGKLLIRRRRTGCEQHAVIAEHAGLGGMVYHTRARKGDVYDLYASWYARRRGADAPEKFRIEGGIDWIKEAD